VTVAKVGRRQSRRTALFLLYQWDLTGQPLASLYDGTPDDFALALAEAIADRAPALDERISAASDAWSADRLGTLERNVLRIGVYELGNRMQRIEEKVWIELAAQGLELGLLQEGFQLHRRDLAVARVAVKRAGVPGEHETGIHR